MVCVAFMPAARAREFAERICWRGRVVSDEHCELKMFFGIAQCPAAVKVASKNPEPLAWQKVSL
jgi:hypothetical protein